MKTVILGAGVAGLAAAHKTGGTIYEIRSHPGGICMSYHANGYRFENGGGHWIFGADDEVMDFCKSFAEMKFYTRNAGVYINNIYPYPIQQYFNGESEQNEGTMKAWLSDKFSKDLCKLFFYPFNYKYTSKMFDYIAPQDDYKNPVKGVGYNSTFAYPARGLDTLITNMANGLNINYNTSVIKIHPALNKIVLSDGRNVEYDRLISSLPLNYMCRLLDIPFGDNLPYTSVAVLNIGAMKGKKLPKEHWLYIPECKSGFHRVGIYSNVDKSFAPKNRVGIYVEWSYVNSIPNTELAVKELKEWGFIKKVEEKHRHTIDIAYTWAWPKTETREKLLQKVEKYGIKQIGRYGKWKFCGIAESIKDGLSC